MDLHYQSVRQYTNILHTRHIIYCLSFSLLLLIYALNILQTFVFLILIDTLVFKLMHNQCLFTFFSLKVRVDFLSGNGQRLASTRQPCMLQFKSQPIRLMLTFFKIAPLVAGYSSESQKLYIKFRGYTERNEPTSCLRVIMEQRAEFTKGAGVPEIYEASLKLESQPPFLKRILWYWKGTIYIWVSIMMFVIELLFTLICCTPIIVPWLQPRGVSVNNNQP